MSGVPGDFGVPPAGQAGDAAAYEEEAEIQYGVPQDASASGSRAEAVLLSSEEKLMSIDGVTGVGIGDGDLGEDAIVVYVRDAAVGQRLPSTLEGVPVQVVVTGEITPY